MTLDTLAREQHIVIRPLTRQIRRDVERHMKPRQYVLKRGGNVLTRGKKRMLRTPLYHDCARCPEAIKSADDAVLDNGHVSHRECAENINRMVDEMNDRAVRERLEQGGVVLFGPKGHGLHLPPGS
jgi:hypothetical protein